MLTPRLKTVLVCFFSIIYIIFFFFFVNDICFGKIFPSIYIFFFFFRIVRNKAAEKAKHAHHIATSNTGSSATGGPVSVIAHAPPTQLSEPRSGAYSINGILGLQHDPNGNSIKRKRIDDHGKLISITLQHSLDHFSGH